MVRRTYSAVVLFSLALALFLSAGCGAKETATLDTATVQSALVGKVWYCQMLFAREVAEDSTLTIEFLADGKVKGSGGCNNFSGPYTLDGEKLRIGPLLSTKKSCGPSLDEQEFTYQSFLSRIQTVKVDDDEMEMYSPEIVEPMVFSTSEDGGGLLW